MSSLNSSIARDTSSYQKTSLSDEEIYILSAKISAASASIKVLTNAFKASLESQTQPVASVPVVSERRPRQQEQDSCDEQERVQLIIDQLARLIKHLAQELIAGTTEGYLAFYNDRIREACEIYPLSRHYPHFGEFGLQCRINSKSENGLSARISRPNFRDMVLSLGGSAYLFDSSRVWVDFFLRHEDAERWIRQQSGAAAND